MNLFGFDLLRPGQSAWTLAAPILLALGILALRRRELDLLRWTSPRQRARFVPGFAAGRARLRLVLACTAAVFTALAVCGPVRGYTEREVQRRGLDLVVCLDTSRSMLVQDLRPDRLTRAKREIRGLVDRMRDDRMALLAFSGDVREVSPLTHDRTTLAGLLEHATPEDNTVGGTDLGAALGHALDLFDGRTGAHEAIILLTDGEDLEGDGLREADRASKAGIQIFVVGMGTPEGGKIPIGGEHGNVGFVVDEKGEEVVSKLSGKSLEAIAEKTGGAYLAASRSAVPLESLYNSKIQRLEGREFGGGVERVPHDRFQWFLVLAMVCMLVETGLAERRPRSSSGSSER